MAGIKVGSWAQNYYIGASKFGSLVLDHHMQARNVGGLQFVGCTGRLPNHQILLLSLYSDYSCLSVTEGQRKRFDLKIQEAVSPLGHGM